MIIIESYRLNMSVTISTSVSAAAIFCSEESLGAPPKRKDMMTMCSESGVFLAGFNRLVASFNIMLAISGANQSLTSENRVYQCVLQGV